MKAQMQKTRSEMPYSKQTGNGGLMSPTEDYFEQMKTNDGCSSFVVEPSNTSVDNAISQCKKNLLPKIGGSSLAPQHLNIKRIKGKQSQSNLLGNQSLPAKSPGVVSDKVCSSGVGPTGVVTKFASGDTPVNRSSQLSVDHAGGQIYKTKSQLGGQGLTAHMS